MKAFQFFSQKKCCVVSYSWKVEWNETIVSLLLHYNATPMATCSNLNTVNEFFLAFHGFGNSFAPNYVGVLPKNSKTQHVEWSDQQLSRVSTWKLFIIFLESSNCCLEVDLAQDMTTRLCKSIICKKLIIRPE